MVRLLNQRGGENYLLKSLPCSFSKEKERRNLIPFSKGG
jgi:hypothetical protein